MKRFWLGLLTAGALIAVVIVAGMSRQFADVPVRKFASEIEVEQREINPWNNLKVNNQPFRFAIVSDRTGGRRGGVFSLAVEQLNLLQPEFVISVGDLIDGSNQHDRLVEQWKEFDGFIGKLQMPFFYVPGNHDISNSVAEKLWQKKFGRSYYHFVYRNVLFLVLNSEDPPGQGDGSFSKAQIDYAKKVLERYKGVSWTMVFLHKPMWARKNPEKSGWLAVESALKGRPYTVFAGHIHRYQKFVRNGQNYYQLATTGGGSKLRGVRYGEFDHITQVTMKKDGPVLANILLEGIWREDLTKPETDEVVKEKKRTPRHPVRGKVTLDGKPVPNVMVVYYAVNGAERKVPDALTNEDGSYSLTTFTPNDGAPEGEYNVTLHVPKPPAGEEHKSDAVGLPSRYNRPATSGLRSRQSQAWNE